MFLKTAPKENLSRVAERGWHGRAPRHGHTVPKHWRTPKTDLQNRPRGTVRPGGTVVPRGMVRPCHVAAGSGWSGLRGLPCRMCSTLRDFRVTLFQAPLALLSAKCCSSFCFFNKVPEKYRKMLIEWKVHKKRPIWPFLDAIECENRGETGSNRG